MKKALFCLVLTLPGIILAQVTEEWVARYDGLGNGWDEATALVVDAAGNVYVTGFSWGSDSTFTDYATVKYNNQGQEVWVARYNGSENHYDDAYALSIDADSYVYVTGSTCNSDSVPDYCTIKYSPQGEEEWVAQYNGPGDYEDQALALAVDTAGNVYVTGSSDDSTSYADYATIKYTPQGVEEWVARYNSPENGGDRARALTIDDAANVYVTGRSWNSISYGDYVTVKYSNDGEEQWVARYNGPGNYRDYAYALAVDSAGFVYVTGYISNADSSNDYCTIKYNLQGEEEWVSCYNGPANGSDRAYDLALDAGGNVYVTGRSWGSDSTFYDYATVKYTSQGEEEWVVRYNDPRNYEDQASALAVDYAGNVYVTGYSYDFFNDYGYCTLKYDQQGEEEWVVRYENDVYGPTSAIAVDESGNVYVTGSISSVTSGLVDYCTIKYSQGPGVAEASPDVSGHRLEVTQLTPEPTISYTLSVSTHVSLKLYDVTGQLVRTLVSGSQEAGTHTIYWDTRDHAGKTVSAGLYFVLLQTPNHSATGKLVVAR